MFNKDSFSNGQIDSKLWMCRELETLGWSSKLTRIYGGWYGLNAFLLLSREKFKVHRIESFDIDSSCKPIADMINENWVIKEWQFKAHTADCNILPPDNVDLVINTSTEHFENKGWFENLPVGTRVVLQGSNMQRDDVLVKSNSVDEFIAHYPLTSIAYQGSLDFVYPGWKFTRYMVIGTK